MERPDQKWFRTLLLRTAIDPSDLFSPDPKHLPYAYHTDGGGWILLSAVPDLDYDINPVKDYDSNTTQPSDRILVLSVDPTNGTRSDGDLRRVKQQHLTSTLRITDKTLPDGSGLFLLFADTCEELALGIEQPA